MNQINQGPVEDQKTIEESDQTEDLSTQKNSATTLEVPDFGWSSYAERINGRFAMIGFLSVLLVELLSRDSFLHWIGLV